MEQLYLFTKVDETELFEEIASNWQLKKAFAEVKGNKGSPGIDGQTIEKFANNLEEEIRKLAEELKNWKYRPKPVKRVEIPKENGKGVRKLGIPCVRDRVVQQAIKMSIEEIFEKEFSESSYGFRPGRNQQQALDKAQEYVKEGREWVVDIDLEKFFDKIHQDRLMTRLAQRIQDKRVLKLIAMTLRSGVKTPEGLLEETQQGSPQGSPLSPLLSNVVLDELDKELEKRGLPFCRFADDCNIYCRSEKAAKRVMESVTKFIEKKMKLVVNKEKSKVAKSQKVKFLGITIVEGLKAIARKTMEKANAKLSELIPRRSHKTVEETITSVNEWFRGWYEYFKITQLPSQIAKIEAHTRRRLRAKIIAQQKNKRNLVQLVIKKGVKKRITYKSIDSKCGIWALSHAKAVEQAFSNTWFKSMGLLTFSENRLSHWQSLKKWIQLT